MINRDCVPLGTTASKIASNIKQLLAATPEKSIKSMIIDATNGVEDRSAVNRVIKKAEKFFKNNTDPSATIQISESFKFGEIQTEMVFFITRNNVIYLPKTSFFKNNQEAIDALEGFTVTLPVTSGNTSLERAKYSYSEFKQRGNSFNR
jgi:hypothetical protein